jgi:hypothetical protein
MITENKIKMQELPKKIAAVLINLENTKNKKIASNQIQENT